MIEPSASGARQLRRGLLVLALLALLVLIWLPDTDAAAQDYLANALTDNLVVYASARTINAIISVIQSFEVSLSLGAGVAVQPGQALDPLNDLVERFSGFVLYGLAGLGLQQVLLVATASLATKLLSSGAIAVMGARLLLDIKLPDWTLRLVMLTLLVRFALVVQVGVSWGLDELYFNTEQQQALSSLEIARDRLQGVHDSYKQAIQDKGVFGGAWQAAQGIMGTDEQQGITDLAATAIVRLIVIMLIKSVLLPIGMIWLLWQLLWRSTARLTG